MYAPATERSGYAAAGYVRWNLQGWDYSFLAGRFRGDDAIGADVAGSIGGLGIRGEATVTRPALGPTYGRALIGADYGFQNTLTLTIELYLKAQGTSDPALYDLGAVLAGRTLSVARHYGAGVEKGYLVVPLAHVVAFLRQHLLDHWDVLRHVQPKDTAFGFLTLLEKSRAEVGSAHEPGSAS